MIALLLAVSSPSYASDASDLRARVATEHARPRPAQFTRAQFLAKPARVGAWLSPDGTQVASLRDVGQQRELWVLDTRTGASRRILSQTQADDLAWSRDGRWMFLPTARQLSIVAAQGQAGSRVIARLGGRGEIEFAGVDPYSPASALLLENPPLVSRQPRRWRIHRVDVHGRTQRIWEDDQPIVDFEVDPGGTLAFLLRAETDRHVLYRIVDGTRRKVMQCVRVERCLLLGTIDQGRVLLMNTDAGGGYGRLVRIETDDRITTLHADPHGEADLQSITLDPHSGQPVFAQYRTTVATTWALQDDAIAPLARLQKLLPARDLRIESGGEGDDARWLVHERASTLKGERLSLYTPRTGRLHEILHDDAFRQGKHVVPALPESAMAPRIPIEYVASDGMRLHAFLTVPVGVDVSRAPLVVNVHGGPFNLVRPEFSAQTQMLANRGYVVFEPNFRGSTGHGRDYLLAGKGDFGNGRVQRDIVEGVRHVLAQRVGDPRRVGILGASFGGYSALQGVTFEPGLFKVAIAAVPPADFGWVLRDYARGPDQMSRGIPMATTMRLLDLDPADARTARRLREESPIANAQRLERPVLLLAGADDERVPIRSVLHYAAQLESLHKDVTLFVDAEGQHQLADPVTREAYLYLTEVMLHRYLGGPAPAAPDAALRASLKKNLRLRGQAFAADP